MESIEKITLIDKDKLNGEFYFESLLVHASEKGLLSNIDIENLQISSLELLARHMQRYTSGDSSSVRIEVAENIMKSNLYTIGLCLKAFDCPDDAVDALKETDLNQLYRIGRKKIQTKLEAARHFHIIMMKNMIKTENYTYRATLVGGIQGFFKLYNPDYDACEIHITADYPLCNPVVNLVGIEFIQKYLEAVCYENIFCNCFAADVIHHLLCGYDEHYQDLVFNIFEQVLTSAIGCSLTGGSVAGLNIYPIQLERLRDILSGKTRDEIETVVLSSYHEMLDEVEITNIQVQNYIKKFLPSLIVKIENAIEMNMLASVFYGPKYLEGNPHICFSLGEKMDDEEYRFIIDEIISCRFTSDKIAIIKEKIHSLADMEDLLFDAELNKNEISAVLKQLDNVEIAALTKRHPYKPVIEAVDLSESEQALRFCLHQHIRSLSEEEQSDIAKTINLLE